MRVFTEFILGAVTGIYLGWLLKFEETAYFVFGDQVNLPTLAQGVRITRIFIIERQGLFDRGRENSSYFGKLTNKPAAPANSILFIGI